MEENSLMDYLNLTDLDLHGQQIQDLDDLTTQYFSKFPNLLSLNLSDNFIVKLPHSFSKHLKQLQILNLNNNKLENIYDAIDNVSLMSNLKSLYINLNKEEQVDYILKSLPKLEYLNGLQVDRDEIYGANDSKGSQRLLEQINEDQMNKIEQQNNHRNSRNAHHENIELMMSEIRETAKEDYNNTQPLSDQLHRGYLMDTQEFQGNNDTVIQEKTHESVQQVEIKIVPSQKQPRQNQNSYNNNTNQFQDPDLNSIIYNHNQRRQSRKNSNSHRASRKIIKNNINGGGIQNQIEEYEEEDLINPDEFEEIAEIYDSIRFLHSKIDPQNDIYLAQDFDNKLKQVMEDLSEVVNNDHISKQIKKERSISSKFELLSMCSEKVCDYIKNPKAAQLAGSPSKRGKVQLENVLAGVFDGYKNVYQDLQDEFIDFIGKSEQTKIELKKNQLETQQLLEAAEHLENQNNYNMKKVQQVEKEKEELQKYIEQLEADNKKYLDTLIKHSKGYDTRELLEDLQSSIGNQVNRGVVKSMAQATTQQQQSQSPSRQFKPLSSRLPNTGAQKKRNNAIISGGSISGGHQASMSMRLQNISLNDSSSPITQQRNPNEGGNNNNNSSIVNNNTSYHNRNSSEMTQNSQINNSISYHFQSLTKKNNKVNLKGLSQALGTQQQRTLTLKQLKDLINDIYSQKTKFDDKCEENKQPKETMEQYMYTYLNQRYGLKNLIIEWAAAIITGIKKYSKDDHEVALFGKILRNECDEKFRFIQQTVKDAVYAILKGNLKEKYPLKGEDQIIKMIEAINNDTIETWQWKKIIEKMYDEEDQKQLENQIYMRLNQQSNTDNGTGGGLMGQLKMGISSKIQQNSARNNSTSKKLTRNQMQQLATEGSNKLKFSLFLKTVLDFQLKEHEKFLSKFIQQFKRVDQDNDGILNEEQFVKLLQSFQFIPEDKIDKILEAIDPYNNQKITFSDCVDRLSQEVLQRHSGNANTMGSANDNDLAILELIAQASTLNE